MKVTLALAVLVLTPASLVFASSAEPKCCDPPAAEASASQTARPVFCRRSALSSEQRQRQGELSGLLRAKLIRVKELERGFEFEFPDEAPVYQALTEFIPFERACCPFFEFGIRLEPERGGLHVALTGSDGVKDFIRQQFSWAIAR